MASGRQDIGCHPGRQFFPIPSYDRAKVNRESRAGLTDGFMIPDCNSASSTARQDFAKIHIRQLLSTLVFCLYHLKHAVCLSVCLAPPPSLLL